MKQALSFDDVLLAPRLNPVTSRSEVSTDTVVGQTALAVPVIAANMPSICNGKMATAMANIGGLGIVHRMQSPERQAREVRHAWVDCGGIIGAAVGVCDDAFERAQMCIDAGAEVICIDIAHGHDTRVRELLVGLLQTFTYITVIAGNIATYPAACYLTSGLRAEDRSRLVLKVGVGGGSVCTTRIQTGCGIPTFQSVQDIASQGYLVIADGGIRNSGDIVKCLAAGAKAVMVGSLLAGTDETPGEVARVHYNSSDTKVYRGAASEGEKSNFYGASDYIEGAETLVDCKGPVADVIRDLTQGIRSGMTYCGAKNLTELRENAEFVQITPAGMAESHPHGVK